MRACTHAYIALLTKNLGLQKVWLLLFSHDKCESAECPYPHAEIHWMGADLWPLLEMCENGAVTKQTINTSSKAFHGPKTTNNRAGISLQTH